MIEDAQYCNRLQRSDWLALYRDAGLVLVEEEPVYADIGSISIDGRFASMDQQDLRCWTPRVVHRKPHRDLSFFPLEEGCDEGTKSPDANRKLPCTG
jgi:hypothetical protein